MDAIAIPGSNVHVPRYIEIMDRVCLIIEILSIIVLSAMVLYTIVIEIKNRKKETGNKINLITNIISLIFFIALDTVIYIRDDINHYFSGIDAVCEIVVPDIKFIVLLPVFLIALAIFIPTSIYMISFRSKYKETKTIKKWIKFIFFISVLPLLYLVVEKFIAPGIYSIVNFFLHY